MQVFVLRLVAMASATCKIKSCCICDGHHVVAVEPRFKKLIALSLPVGLAVDIPDICLARPS